jgi:ribosomal protein S18 acetylase RimI-like enzyme
LYLLYTTQYTIKTGVFDLLPKPLAGAVVSGTVKLNVVVAYFFTENAMRRIWLVFACGLLVSGLSLASEKKTFAFTLSDGQEVICVQRTAADDLSAEEAVFVQAFANAYKDVPLSVLKVADLQAFLREAFDDERQALRGQTEEVYFFSALIDNQVVGMITFSPYGEDVLYGRQLAVAPAFQDRGIARCLAACCLCMFPQTKKIVLAIRRINQHARALYEQAGCTETADVPYGYNPERYVGYECAAPHLQKLFSKQ